MGKTKVLKTNGSLMKVERKSKMLPLEWLLKTGFNVSTALMCLALPFTGMLYSAFCSGLSLSLNELVDL